MPATSFEAGIRTEFGSEPDEVSALELIFNLPTVDGRRVTRLSKSDERYLISGGTDQVAKALAAEHRGHVQLNKRLVAVDLGADSVRLAFAGGGARRRGPRHPGDAADAAARASHHRAVAAALARVHRRGAAGQEREK